MTRSITRAVARPVTRAHRRLLSLAAVLALGAPALAQANALWHPAHGEIGFTEHPGHLSSGKTRAQVVAEVQAARRDGTLFLAQRNMPMPAVKVAGAAKTRQQVIAELRNETPAERQARLALDIGG